MYREVGRDQTNQLLKKHGILLKKSLGQNFLTDPRIAEKIAEAAQLGAKDGVLEIGPGAGALTKALVTRAKKVVAVEIDGRLIPVLEELFAGEDRIQIIHGDILKIDLHPIVAMLLQQTDRLHVVANLPYYVTTPILMHLLKQKLPFTQIVVMVQKEVADRIGAGAGNKEYGSLSVACQYYAKVEKVLQVPRQVFLPQPDVDSTVIRLALYREPPVKVRDEALFFHVVRASFAQRRKTIYNNLRFAYPELSEEIIPILEGAGIHPSRRGETLTIEEFAALANRMDEALKMR